MMIKVCLKLLEIQDTNANSDANERKRCSVTRSDSDTALPDQTQMQLLASLLKLLQLLHSLRLLQLFRWLPWLNCFNCFTCFDCFDSFNSNKHSNTLCPRKQTCVVTASCVVYCEILKLSGKEDGRNVNVYAPVKDENALDTGSKLISYHAVPVLCEKLVKIWRSLWRNGSAGTNKHMNKLTHTQTINQTNRQINKQPSLHKQTNMMQPEQGLLLIKPIQPIHAVTA